VLFGPVMSAINAKLRKQAYYYLLMGRQIILKWSYLMIFMRVLVAVSVRWCIVYA